MLGGYGTGCSEAGWVSVGSFFLEEPGKYIPIIPGMIPVPLIIASRSTIHLRSML